MIVDEKKVAILSTMQGAEYRAGVDDEDMGHIIGLFTDLYSDQERAVIREYSTNARDAQIEAGVDRAIEVSLPGPLSPSFKVRDFGIGLDADSIRTIYSRYGRSTKRATNDQNGALGLGCKSALTYSDQFTIESNKNGVKTICVVTREEGGVPVFQVLAEQPTTEDNGTTVIVPVLRHNNFETKAMEHFSTWAMGTVLVDGAIPDAHDGLKIGEGLYVQKHDYYDRKPNRVVMSGVTYPVDSGQLDVGLPREYSLLAFVPNGSVNFTPSREALMYTQNTLATLAALKPRVTAGIQKAVQTEIDKTTSVRAAIEVMREWRSLLGSRVTADSFTFRGKGRMPEVLSVHGEFVEHASRKIGKSQWLNQLSLDYVPDTLFFVGFDVDKFTPTHKRKLLQYVESEDCAAKYYMLVGAKSQIDMTWVESSQLHQWADVKAQKLPKTGVTTQSGRPTGSYDAYTPNGSSYGDHVQADQIDTSERIFYARAENKYEARSQVEALRTHFPKMTLVCLPENRVAKFQRNFPAAISYEDAFKEAYVAWEAKLTPEQREALVLHDSGLVNTLSKLDPAKVDDPVLKAAVRRVHNTYIRDIVSARQQIPGYRYALTVPDGWVNPLDGYMIFEQLDWRYVGDAMLPQAYLAINAAYKAGKP